MDTFTIIAHIETHLSEPTFTTVLQPNFDSTTLFIRGNVLGTVGVTYFNNKLFAALVIDNRTLALTPYEFGLVETYCKNNL